MHADRYDVTTISQTLRFISEVEIWSSRKTNIINIIFQYQYNNRGKLYDHVNSYKKIICYNSIPIHHKICRKERL